MTLDAFATRKSVVGWQRQRRLYREATQPGPVCDKYTQHYKVCNAVGYSITDSFYGIYRQIAQKCRYWVVDIRYWVFIGQVE